MPFSTITTPEARPVANYKMATRMEGGRLLYVSGQVAWDASGNIVGTIYAFSTLGSIFGTFITGFYLISLFGTRQIDLRDRFVRQNLRIKSRYF